MSSSLIDTVILGVSIAAGSIAVVLGYDLVLRKLRQRQRRPATAGDILALAQTVDEAARTVADTDTWPEPPWGTRMPVEEQVAIHPRWADQLKKRMPAGVPLDPDSSEPWPITFGSRDEDGVYVHGMAGDYTLQCGGCRYYVPLEGPLGANWGACANPIGEYDRTLVFEHWTCAGFRE